MCGIVGVVHNSQKPIERQTLELMNRQIFHRGPDEDGFYLEENVGLAMRRLAIIDLAGGQQPIFNQNRTKAIVFNGEIYNFQELRQNLQELGHRFETNCDTEVIVHLYDRYGADCLQYLRGMFAFAIWDETDKSLFIARDRIGKKPLLYAHKPNGDLIFGSEFQALLAHPAVGKTVDYAAINDYLSLAYIPAPQTAFAEIRKLAPGHWLRWRAGEIKIERYWQPDFSNKIKISEPEAEAETLRLIREAVRLRMISEVPLGAFLSGGVDSSIVTALMAQESSQPVKTFSIGFEERDYSELKYAKAVADHIGAEHHEFVVKPDALDVLPKLVEHYGEPYADESAIPTYYVARETRRHVTVALNGDGGDESFAGYERYAAMRFAEKYHRMPRFARESIVEKLVDYVPTSELKRSRARDLKRFLRAASQPRAERYFHWMSQLDRETKSELLTEDFKRETAARDPGALLADWFQKANGAGIVDAAMLVDQHTYLPDDLLVKVDIASMANSLEARSPLLDHKVMEFAASLPENLKLRGATTKYLLKKIAAKLVPPAVIYRKKMGFGVPIAAWFRHELKDFAQATLLSEKALKRGIVKPAAVTELVRSHVAGERDHAFKIWNLLMLELWFERFID